MPWSNRQTPRINRRRRLTVILSCVFAIACGESRGAEVAIPDPNLRGLLQEVLQRKGIDSKAIDSEDLLKIQVLDGSSRDIADLTGLQSCTNLVSLVLSRNSIVDITPVSGCVRLQSLDLQHNDIESIAALQLLDRLQYLNLDQNRVASLSPLRKSIELRTLFAGGNAIESLASLEELNQLRSLYLSRNTVTDMEPLARMTMLRTIDLSDNQLTDVSVIQYMPQLQTAFLMHNQISNIDGLHDLIQHPEFQSVPGQSFYLVDNPLQPAPSSTVLMELRKRGIYVDLVKVDSKHQDSDSARP